MAKKTEVKKPGELSLAEKLRKIRTQNEKINQEAGKTVVGFLNDPEIEERLTLKFIPTPSRDLNAAIGGGIPVGRTTVITGLSDSGKTGLVLETIGLAMAKDENFVALWLESEGSISDMQYLTETFHIDPARFVMISMDSNVGGEKAAEQAMSYLKLGVVNLFCINSLKALVPKTELFKPVSEDNVATSARFVTKFLKQVLPIIYDNDIALVLIQHLSTMIGSMSRDPLAMSGGLFLRYGNMLTIDMRKQSIGPDDPITKEEGMKVCVSVKKNHITPRFFPYKKCYIYFVYSVGLEQILSTLKSAVEQGILKQSGAWIMWEAKGLRWQGKAKFREEMKTNPGLFKELCDVVDCYVSDLTEEELEQLQIDPLADQAEMKLVPVDNIEDLDK